MRKTIRAFSTDPIAARALVALPQVYAEGVWATSTPPSAVTASPARFPGSEAGAYAGDKLATL